MIFVIMGDLNMSNKWFVVDDKEDALTIGRMTGERFYTWDEGTRFTFRRSFNVYFVNIKSVRKILHFYFLF